MEEEVRHGASGTSIQLLYGKYRLFIENMNCDWHETELSGTAGLKIVNISAAKLHCQFVPILCLITARNNPAETPSAKVTIFRNTSTQLPRKPFCNFQGVIL